MTDLDRSTDALRAEWQAAAVQEQERQRAEREVERLCVHDFTVLRAGIRRETPDDGVSYHDVFYCRRCLAQRMVKAVVS